MKTNSIKEFDSLIQQAEQRQKEALFWRYEYVKRNFYSQDQNNFKYTLNVLKDLEEFMSEYLDEYPSAKEKIGTNILQLMYKCFFMEKYGDTGTSVCADKLNVREIFYATNFPDNISEILDFLIEQSQDYGYFPWDLVQQTDMKNILQKIMTDDPLPLAPIFHINWKAQGLLPDEVLTIVECNPNRSNKEVSLTKQIWQEYYQEKLEGEPIQLCGITRCPDFIIMAQIFSPQFDIDKGIQEIHDRIANRIFLYKKEKGHKLTVAEQHAILRAYKNQSSGQYGKEYSIARGAGLWLWDYLNISNHNARKIDAIRELRATGLCPSYSASSDKTFYRLLDATAQCIEAQEVLPIKTDREMRQKVS